MLATPPQLSISDHSPIFSLPLWPFSPPTTSSALWIHPCPVLSQTIVGFKSLIPPPSELTSSEFV